MTQRNAVTVSVSVPWLTGVSAGQQAEGMRNSEIAVTGLRKTFGDKVVLDGIDFEVAAGSVFSLLGPNGAGKTTTVNILATLMKEADQLADRIAVLDQGRLVAQGTPEELKRLVPGTHVRLRFADPGDLETAERVLDGATRDAQELTLRVPSDGKSRSLRELLDKLDEHTIDAEEFSVHTPDLDDVFLALTGHASTEAIAK
jgi:ABC-type multidrug transport system ATPase subunit